MMDDAQSRVEQERQLIREARARGTGSKLAAYARLSGPGWLQSAITLGGGSLAGSLYLGVLAGYNLMWLQPLAMIMGIVMLSAISYVTLSTGDRPFQAINRHINPVLGWGWAVATLMANMVWCIPQFGLGTAALQQNLGPETFSSVDSPLFGAYGKEAAVGLLFVVASIVVWFYDSGGWGVKLFETVLKIMVGIVVLCFFGVVFQMTFGSNTLDWGPIFAGFIPDLTMLFEPSPQLQPFIAATGEYADYWTAQILDKQRSVMVTAAATAVGINMTFLLPYSMLRKGWDRDFRGLAIFDLSTGLLIPFMLATSCVVIASASQFHTRPSPGLMGERTEEGVPVVAGKALTNSYNGLVDGRLKVQLGEDALKELARQQAEAAQNGESSGALDQARAELSEADRRMAAMLAERDAFDLANALEPLTGKGTSQYVFGVGVLGMAVSTIIILMLINGFVVCEMLGMQSSKFVHRLGCYMVACFGAVIPFYWDQAMFYLAVPTSVFGMVLLPIAYGTFFLMMNSPALMGESMPRGGKRVLWNTLMATAFCLASVGSLWSIWSKTQWAGLGGLAAFLGLAFVVHIFRGGTSLKSAET